MADYTIVNVVALLVGLLFVGTGVHLVRTGRESVAAFLLTTAVGFGLVFVALFPGAFDLVARVLGLELRARAILVISNLTLFVLVTYLLNRIGRLSDRVSRLNERLSLLDRELEDRTFEDREFEDRTDE
ncbi:DUF2304 domain-containing protein [Halopenitus persicus]|uniref:DUF2304 domain-containing protein n=1 Tax=Halopenitus persicus TaxID=1048396 RepID=A0A1H3MN38_9EURY|nr:DUF2304 domain-containing protein [Halopenitus persicus]QHS16178.1 DUF2304 domain-containing protein [haloarchaeon 3A1-DGR]SDY78006.1 hypothetical protein SAMN05216564_11013 [Halopenitus persicus]